MRPSAAPTASPLRRPTASLQAPVQVSSALALTCPYTLRSIHIDAKQFFGSKFSCIAGSRQLVRYVILDCEPTGERHGRFHLAEVQVCPMPRYTLAYPSAAENAVSPRSCH